MSPRAMRVAAILCPGSVVLGPDLDRTKDEEPRTRDARYIDLKSARVGPRGLAPSGYRFSTSSRRNKSVRTALTWLDAFRLSTSCDPIEG